MSERTTDLTTIIFKGPMFEDHGLEIDILAELIAYKRLLVETAKEFWKSSHPERKNLPPGFGDSVRLKFYELGKGSTSVELKKVMCSSEGELPLSVDDEFDKAAVMIEDGIDAFQSETPLPQDIPKNIMESLKEMGKSLGEEDKMVIHSPKRAKPVEFTPAIRRKIEDYVECNYLDSTEVEGEVRSADLDNYNFTIRSSDGDKIKGKFKPEQEHLVTEALQHHEQLTLKINGLGEYERNTGKLVRLQEVRNIEIKSPAQALQSSDDIPIWEMFSNISKKISAKDWENIPSDLSENVDLYLYGAERRKK